LPKAVLDYEFRLERHEQSAWRDFCRSIDSKTWPNSKICSNEHDGVLMMSIPSVDVLTFNRVLGMGLFKPATEQLVDDLITWYKSTGACRFMVTLGPLAVPTQVERWLVGRGFQFHSKSVILLREIRTIPEPSVRLQVKRVLPAEAQLFGQVAASGFGWPRKTAQIIANSVGREGWQHYLVYDGSEPIATGASFSAERFVWFGFGATKSKYRRLGAQTALIACRIKHASENHKTPIVDVEPESNSYRNCWKLGFEQVCLRSQYVYNFDRSPRPMLRAVSRIVDMGRQFLKGYPNAKLLLSQRPS
jgi:hypothetical protein